MVENPMVAAQFYERSVNTYSLLWMNPNSHTLIAQTTYAYAYAGYWYIQPYITGLNNPTLATKAIFSARPT